MNIINIIKFIGEKNPKYNWDDLQLPVRPVKGKGYMDDNGLKQGEWEEYVFGVLNYRFTYKDGKKNGVCFGFYDGGRIVSFKANYLNDVKNGYYEGYWANGNVEQKGNYKDGKKEGVWEEYYKDGTLSIKKTYKNGKQIDYRLI